MKRSPTDSYFVQVEYAWRNPDGEGRTQKRVTPLFHSKADDLHSMYHEYRQEMQEEFKASNRHKYMKDLVIIQFHVEPNELED